MKIEQTDNNVLRQKAKEILPEEIGSKKVEDLLEKMTKTMIESKDGLALAAPQIGESLRMFIVDRDIWEKKNKEKEEYLPSQRPPVVFINPIIKKISSKKMLVMEGCLSVEKVNGTIKRSEKLTVEALDERGKKFTRGVSGLLAQIVQHEIDHLDGVLFIDKAVEIRKIEKHE